MPTTALPYSRLALATCALMTAALLVNLSRDVAAIQRCIELNPHLSNRTAVCIKAFLP